MFTSTGSIFTVEKSGEHYKATWRESGNLAQLKEFQRNKQTCGLITRTLGKANELYPYVTNASSISPQMMTLIPTYRCNAQCEQCCFESNPDIPHRLTRDLMIDRTKRILDAFPDISLFVVSGGECFLLGEDLFNVLNFAASRGMITRCVTNGFWGRTRKTAKRTAQRLVEVGIHEMNISTGKDHQQWVSRDAVLCATEELVKAGIRIAVTIESDSEDSEVVQEFIDDPRVSDLVQDHSDLFVYQVNTWMPFQEGASGRGEAPKEGGCDQIFKNIVVTPHDMLSACCGLTLEHIPEMKLGSLSDIDDVEQSYQDQLGDFLKIWIHMDGPKEILKQLFGDDVEEDLQEINHICQSCVLLHKHPGVRNELESRYHEFVPDVLARFNLKRSVNNLIAEKAIN